MEGLKESLHEIIAEVLKNYDLTQVTDNKKAFETGPGIFKTMEEAVQAAVIAQRELILMPLSKRKEIIQAIRDIVIQNREVLSINAAEETGFGRKEDKVIKHILAASKTPGVEDLEPEAFSDEHGLTLVEKAPYGVIGAIIPSTNPTSTVTSNGIGMIAAGNSVVFNPHPFAKKVSCQLISMINEAIVAVGGPKNLMTSILKPNIESANELMTHKNIAILVVTGGPAVVKAAMNSGKKVIAAGPGNPPCVVDETADLVKAGKDIVNGASFDNNIICICEKEVIVVQSVADKLKDEMKKNGAFELSGDQITEITKLVISQAGCPGKEGVTNKDYVGKSARYIAGAIGIDVPESTKLLLCEVPTDHPLIWTEQLMPVLPLTRVDCVDTAIDLAVSCEHGFRHTAMMHSRNIEKLSKMAKIMNCSLFVKNGPSYAGLAQGGAGFTSFTIASPTGEGLTRARTFTRERRCTLVDYFRIV
ncbi:MAG: aldehyde dehydrogenase EutE [Spirochaetaceae bacterium]|jgi:acyl-CoA reductase-like NAD-dependent aldehyde dehydrogenase|nr:aldehyde dehydrogenase EutE [Spirochaetaceae bacterium]